jgi:hypothetical protein
MSQTFGKLAQALTGLEALRQSRSPLETREAHQTRTMRAAAKLSDQLSRLKSDAGQAYANSVVQAEARISEAARLVPSEFAAEIRQAFRQMTPGERTNALADIVKSGDGPTLAALRDSPKLLHGMDASILQRVIQQHAQAAAPAELAALQSAKDAMDVFSALATTAQRRAHECQDQRLLAEIEAADQAAREATATFEAALA